MQEIALAAIRYYQKLVPLTTALFAGMDLLAHFRLWMQEYQREPLKIYERVAQFEKKRGHIVWSNNRSIIAANGM